MKYIIIAGDKVIGNTNSIKRANKICKRIEQKKKLNCDIAKLIKR